MSKPGRWLDSRSIIFFLGIALIAGCAAGLALGSVSLSPSQLWSALIRAPQADPITQVILWQLRLPRVLLAMLVGGALSVAGATFQGLFRNPMADPYIIGASSGAALGATLAIALSLDFLIFGLSPIPVMAFLGSLLAVSIAYYLAKTGGRVSMLSMLLAGVAISSLFSALVSLCIFLSGGQLSHVLFWMMGGLSRASWRYIAISIPYLALGLGVVLYYARQLDAMLLGDETAVHLGINIDQLRRQLVMAATLLTAAAVAVSGTIGFVGLIVPHLVRLLLGPRHVRVLPVSALAGALILLLADLVARTIISPAELPVGLVTALAGAPFFLYILRSRQRDPLS
ncbi:MAG: iron ABC transporter permease [Bacillota bacterium]